MKKVLAILLFLPFAVKAQDSVKISVTVQARDLELMGFVCSFDQDEEWFDSVKVKFRVQNPPTGNTQVTIGNIYTTDWVRAYSRIHWNHVAVKAGAVGRVSQALKNVNQAYLTSKIAQLESGDTTEYINLRSAGRLSLRKTNN
jgi:hypothetical protein